MNLNYLKTFSLLSTNLSFSKTADIQRTSQPAISRQIKLLEEHFGQPLFIRNKKSVVLSEFGHKLKLKITSSLLNLDNALNFTSEDNAKEVIRGSSIPEFGRYNAFVKLLPFLKSNSDINLFFSLESSIKIFDDIHSGKIDFGITHVPPKLKSIESIKLKEEKSVLIGSHKSDIKDLYTKKSISYVGYREDDNYSHTFIEKNFKKNIREKFIQEYSVNSHGLMCDLIATKNCYGILPLSSIQNELKSKKIKILLENKTEDNIYFVYHESLNKIENKIQLIKKIITALKI